MKKYLVKRKEIELSIHSINRNFLYRFYPPFIEFVLYKETKISILYVIDTSRISTVHFHAKHAKLHIKEMFLSTSLLIWIMLRSLPFIEYAWPFQNRRNKISSFTKRFELLSQRRLDRISAKRFFKQDFFTIHHSIVNLIRNISRFS